MRKHWIWMLSVWVFMTIWLLPGAASAAAFPGGSFAEEDSEDIVNYSLEDLLNTEITTAGKKAEKLGDIPASVVLITRDDIKRYGYQSLEEILINAPGLYMIDDMAYGSVFGVRGFWSGSGRNMVYMVNGIPQVQAYSDATELPNLNVPVEAIDRIEVIRGPMAVMYGSGAFFGVVNLITDDNHDKKSASMASLSYGSMNTLRAALRVSGQENDLKYTLNAGYLISDGPDEPLTKMVTNLGALAAFGISAANRNTTTGTRLEDNNKYVNLSASYKGFYSTISYSQGKKEHYVILPSFSNGTVFDRGLFNLMMGYERKFSDTFSLNLKLTYHLFEWFFDYDFFAPETFNIQNNASEEINAELIAIYTPSEEFNLMAGLYYRNIPDIPSLVDVPWLSIPNIVWNLDSETPIINRAAYVQANYHPFPKLKLVAGLRADQVQEYSILTILYGSSGLNQQARIEHSYSEDNVQLIPRFAAIYEFNARNIVKFLYGRAINHPSFFQAWIQGYSGFPNVAQEYIDTFELNYIATPGPQIMINLSLFYNTMSNLITRTLRVNPDGTLSTYYSNAGKKDTIGVELTAQWKPLEHFLLEISGAWQKSTDKRAGFEGRTVEYSPPLLAYLKASYAVTGFSAAILGRFTDGMVPYWDLARVNPGGAPGGRIGSDVSGYISLDANIRLDNFLNTGFYLNAHCSNILNNEYLFPVYTENSWMNKGTPGRSRAFAITLGKEF